MTRDPRCEPLLNELLSYLVASDLIRDSSEIWPKEHQQMLDIIDKHLCPCGHNYRQRNGS